MKGSFRGVDVVRRGASPRIVDADIVGTRGRTRVSGPQIRARLGLERHLGDVPRHRHDERAVEAVDLGRRERRCRAARVLRPDPGLRCAARRVAGHRPTPVGPSRWLRIERRTAAGSWATELETRAQPNGTYRAAVRRAGTYRVRVGADTGPLVRVR